MNSETIRAFIAIELPDAVKNEIVKLETDLKKNSPDVVKWVDPDGIHLTLKFLGNITTAQAEEVLMGMEEAVQGVVPFNLEVRGAGAFPGLNRVQVVWVGLKGELDKLSELQRRVVMNMEQLGFPKEDRGFTPHLTLGRLRNYARPEDRKKIGEVLSKTTFVINTSFTAEAVHLVKSRLTPKGAIYTVIDSVRLKG